MADINIYGSNDFTADGSLYENVRIAGSGDIRGPLKCCKIDIFGSGDILGDVTCENDVSIRGSGDILGNLSCGGSFTVSGSGDVRGDLICGGDISIRGSGDIKGTAKCSNLVIAGSGDIGKDVICSGKVIISGSGDISGNVTSHELVMTGSGCIGGDASCEKAQIGGMASISGLLNAESIEIIPGCVEINEIGCTSLSVNTSSNKSSRGRYLRCNVIEGDDIFLEYTTAKTVRGKNIVIGRGCEIETVEYTENIEVNDKSTVRKPVKI